jgi:magnesium-protoporphyrin O-methyltransferase
VKSLICWDLTDMNSTAYLERRTQLEHYFDRTAAKAWERLTSDAPVSRIRATVRAGRDRMRQAILDMLPLDLSGRRVLDAGCGTGALATALAARGAHVIAIDLSPTLVELARQRAESADESGSIEFLSGDMTDPRLGSFDHVVAMDSLIHYEPSDVVRVLGGIAARTTRSIVFTFAPRTPALALMHSIGRAFPRSDRAPLIAPVAEAHLRAQLGGEASLHRWRTARHALISQGFYKSHALELMRA